MEEMEIKKELIRLFLLKFISSAEILKQDASKLYIKRRDGSYPPAPILSRRARYNDVKAEITYTVG
jgi:hypothetical protein